MSDVGRLCVLVRYADGTESWEPMAPYLRNPAFGSYIVRDNKRVHPDVTMVQKGKGQCPTIKTTQ